MQSNKTTTLSYTKQSNYHTKLYKAFKLPHSIIQSNQTTTLSYTKQSNDHTKLYKAIKRPH